MENIMRLSYGIAVAVLALTAACKEESPPIGGGAMAASNQSGMGGMSGAAHQDAAAENAQALLAKLGTDNADSLASLVPLDNKAVTALIRDCEQMMKSAKMTPPKKWNDAVAALHDDLSRFPGLTGDQLKKEIPAHRGRVEDMLAMRRDMMKMM